MQHWYLFDRFFVSFLIFGVCGVLAWVFRSRFDHLIMRWWPGLVGLLLLCFWWTNRELFSYGFPVELGNAPYYKPSMTLYAFAVIGLLSALCLAQVKRHRPFTKFVHRFAGMAYKAYLSNVCWSTLLWLSFGRQLTTWSPLLGIVVVYLLTWPLSFGSAFGLHYLWSAVKQRGQRIRETV